MKTFPFALMVLMLLAPGLRSEETPPTDPAAAPAATDPALAVSTAPVEPAYVYKGDRTRDPFIPLGGTSTGMTTQTKVESGPFNPAGAELKGIVRTPTGRWALVRTSDGSTYVIQNGKIYDPKRKPVEGYQGIVKERSVFILAPGNQEFEMKLKKDEEASKKS